MGTEVQWLLWWFKFRSGKSFFNLKVCGSFTWLYYNRTNILENQTLLLARVRFIRAPLAAFWRGFSKNSWRGLHYLPAEFSTFLLVTQQPRVLWQNGGYAWIHLVK